jgi:DNA modification methylase
MNWPEDYIDKVICGDCLEVMKGIPDKSVDLAVTDPPYGVYYEGGHFHSGDVNIQRKRESLVNDDTNIYPALFSEIYRLLKDGSGGAYVFYAGSLSQYVYPPLPFQKYQMLIWGKSNARFAAMMARYKHDFEPFLWLQKPPTKWNGDSRQRSLWWMKANAQNDCHPTQKPIPVIEKMIRNSSNIGDLILDPFLGSGTTAVAAKNLGRHFIGIEIEPKYVAIANQRLQQEILL